MAKNSDTEASRCPCGGAAAYNDCCGRYHASGSAPDATSLMRSRYCAFVLRDAPYLLSTWHRTTRPNSIDFEPQQKWLKLEIVGSTASQSSAEVEFIARFRVGGGSARRHHEVSRFVREDGRWFYVDGELKR